MAERYRPLFRLDSGGMAEVYVAEAESLGGFKKKVAIKRILPGLLKDERFVRMFLDEARLSLHLNHANIVTVFDIGKSENAYFIVMEYVDGANLKRLLEHQARRGAGGMPVPLVVWILNEILKGLDYAHHLRDAESNELLNIVHRDISPPNILLSWNGEVKLTDFGLAKATTQVETTDPGIVKGKFSYLSPEAAYGLEIDKRSDIFAAGILAYEMLTGQRLFLGDTDYKTVELVRRAEIPSLRTLNPEIPAPLEQIILKALARDLGERYESANDFAEDLLRFLFSHGVKVSARDLSAYLAELRREASSPEIKEARTTNLIMDLIEDELLNFRSLEDSDDDLVTGAQPLDFIPTSTAQPQYDPGKPLVIDDLGPPMQRAGKHDGSSSTPAGAVYATSGAGAHASPVHAARGSNMMPWVVLATLGVLGAGAYYWLVVLGNLKNLAAG